VVDAGLIQEVQFVSILRADGVATDVATTVMVIGTVPPVTLNVPDPSIVNVAVLKPLNEPEDSTIPAVPENLKVVKKQGKVLFEKAVKVSPRLPVTVTDVVPDCTQVAQLAFIVRAEGDAAA
jgi:hypothetical protein